MSVNYKEDGTPTLGPVERDVSKYEEKDWQKKENITNKDLKTEDDEKAVKRLFSTSNMTNEFTSETVRKFLGFHDSNNGARAALLGLSNMLDGMKFSLKTSIASLRY